MLIGFFWSKITVIIIAIVRIHYIYYLLHYFGVLLNLTVHSNPECMIPRLEIWKLRLGVRVVSASVHGVEK